MTPNEVAARTEARMRHLKELLSPEEWAEVVGTCGTCNGSGIAPDHSPMPDDEQPCSECVAGRDR